MIFKKLNWKLFLPFVLLLAVTSCDTEDEFYSYDTDYDALLQDIDLLTRGEYTTDLAELDFRSEDEEMMHRFKGKRTCFKFVFPLTIVFPDGETLTVESDEAFRDAMHTWKEANPEAEDRPYIQMPFDVIVDDGTEEGAVITIETEEQFQALHQDCFEKRPHLPKFRLCLDPVFPISIAFPDGTTQTVEDEDAFRTLMREWKEANPDAEVRPEIVFPIEVVNQEGTTIEVNDIEELKELLKDCVEKMKKHGKKKKGKPGDKGGDKDGNGGEG